jgi:polysaccharide export outer membrane protein
VKSVLALLIVGVAAGVWCDEPVNQSFLTLGPGDLISVEVFDVPELKQEIRISDRGEAQLALLGKVQLAGLTVMEAQQLLSTRLQAERFVVAPQVSLLVREYVTQSVAVSGEVRKPGVYAVLGPKTLVQVLAEAGGLTEAASSKIRIRHVRGEEELIEAIDANAEWRSKLLRPGDTVVVARAGIAYLVGDVARSGGYLMQDGGTLSVAQLITLGGGTLHTAKASRAKLVRRSGDQRQEIPVNVPDILRGRAPDLQLEPDDILFVPNSAWKNAANRLQNISQMAAGAAIYTSLN